MRVVLDKGKRVDDRRSTSAGIDIGLVRVHKGHAGRHKPPTRSQESGPLSQLLLVLTEDMSVILQLEDFDRVSFRSQDQKHIGQEVFVLCYCGPDAREPETAWGSNAYSPAFIRLSAAVQEKCLLRPPGQGRRTQCELPCRIPKDPQSATAVVATHRKTRDRTNHGWWLRSAIVAVADYSGSTNPDSSSLATSTACPYSSLSA